jgi:hypothetical protein
MRQRKVISLPSNEKKIYRQILAFMNFMLNLTLQERDVLAELIRLDNEYEALPPDKRGKFILSTDMRKEIREELGMEEKQFNVVLSRLKSTKKVFMGRPLIDENNIMHPELKFKPDNDGFKFEVNLVMTAIQPVKTSMIDYVETTPVTTEKVIEEFKNLNTPPTEYKYDAAQAPVLEEEDFDIDLNFVP